MADSLTANYNLVKPEVGGSGTTWGDKTNENWDEVDGLIKGLDDDKFQAGFLHALTEKTSVVDADEFHLTDSAATFADKRITFATIKAALKSYFDQWLYAPGDIKYSCVKAAPSGWLILNGNSIGNAASGGTARANADTAVLFAILWDNYAQTELPIQTSTGAASTRGASAAVDYAANKRMPLPDIRGRVVAGWDNLANVARLTAPLDDTFGAAGGSATHTLSSAEMPVHTHDGSSLSTNTTGAHGHTIAMETSGDDNPGGGDSRISTSGGSSGSANPATYISANSAGNHAHTVSGNVGNAGTGNAHNNTQPTIIANVLIKL
jgi:microcystin-dependent protein